MPTTDEINAGFNAIEPDLHSFARQFVPSFFQGQAMQALDSQEGRKDVVEMVRKVLAAAEGVRAKVAPPKASSPR